MTLEKEVSVTEQPDASVAGRPMQKPGSHDGGAGQSIRALADWAIGPIVKNRLQQSFRELFKPKIEFVPISIPTKIATADGMAPRLDEAGSLLPLEVKAENGWLAVGSTFCSEGMRPLGVSVTPWRSDKTGRNWLSVGSVTAYSPAWNNYFAAGDWIQSFGEPGKDPIPMTETSSKPFLDFIASRAKGADASARTVEIVGQDAKGKEFRRTISLCPANMDHRTGAKQVMASMLGTN
jgi:hypothetical protein